MGTSSLNISYYPTVMPLDTHWKEKSSFFSKNTESCPICIGKVSIPRGAPVFSASSTPLTAALPTSMEKPGRAWEQGPRKPGLPSPYPRPPFQPWKPRAWSSRAPRRSGSSSTSQEPGGMEAMQLPPPGSVGTCLQDGSRCAWTR